MMVRAFRFPLLLSLAVPFLSQSWASVDRPAVSNLVGVAYHEGGWFSCGTDVNKESGYLQFDNNAEFILAPRYAGSVRKIILNVKCSSPTPKRDMLLKPFVNGVETDDPALVCSVTSTVVSTEFTCISFDFNASAGIDSFRLVVQGSATTFGIADLIVFHGEKTEDEEKVLREFAHQLPAPTELHVECFTDDSLTLKAAAVEGAEGYCFEVNKLEGAPRTEVVEHFSSSTDLSDGWTFGETNNVKLTRYVSDSMTDTKTSDGVRSSLSIAKTKDDQPAKVEVLSPVVEEPIVECSFFCKYSSSGSGDTEERICIYGQKRGETAWSSLGEEDFTVSGSGQWQTNAISISEEIVRVKFVFEADAGKCRNCSLDTLRIVYGGNETRTLVSDGGTITIPECALEGLETARYGYRVKAIGNLEYRDSSWSEEGIIDLAWADIQLSAPENLAYEVSGDKLNLSWSPVAMADHYEVTVAPADDPENPVATLTTRTASASVPIAELGDYVVTVMAVAPGGVSTATASPENCTVTLGKVTGLEVEATAADTISAKWDAVPLAESYQAKLFKVTGDAGTEISDYSKLPEGVWPDGWEHYSYDTETYSGNPKLKYRDSWIKTGTYPQPITEVKFSFRSHVSGVLAEEVTKTYIRVEGSEDGVTWTEIAAHQVTTAMQSITEIVPYGDGRRRIRFSVQYVGENPNYTNLNIEFGKVMVSYGEYVRTEVESVGTKDCAATYRGLDRTAKYVVVVTPQPSEGTECEASSVIVDLASEYFRPVGPVSIAGLRGGVYVQRFDALASMTKEADLRRVPLENWQFFYGSGEAEKLYYTSGTNSTKGGVYCYSDAERTTNSFMIGTVAVKTTGSSVGLAFANDTGMSLRAPTLTFTAVRRNERPGDPYELEWLVTDGPWSIGTESDRWQALPLREDEPGFSVTPENCQLAPGQVIIFRWRQEKVTGGPMLGLDDVHVEFPINKPGFMFNLR